MLPPIKAFGDELSLVEVFVDYDGPQLFSAVGATKTNYLAVHAPRDERGDNWLYVVISKARLRKFSNNEVSVHDAFADPEGGLVRIVSFDAKGNASVATVRANELPEHFIPQDRTVATPSQVLYRRMPAFDLRTLPDELRDATPMWEVSPQTLEYLKSIRTPVEVASARTGRLVADLILRSGDGRTDVSLPALGSLLATAQKLVDALAAPDSSHHGPIKGAIQQWTRLDAVAVFPSSFGLRIESHYGSFLTDTEGALAFDRLINLLNAGSDENVLKRILPEYGKRAVLHYRAFARALDKSDAAFELTVGKPGEAEAQSSGLTRDQIRQLQRVLDSESKKTEETVTFMGRLTAASLPKRFFVLENDESIVYGSVPKDVVSQLDGRTIGEIYIAVLKVIIEVDDTTAEEKVRYELISLRLRGE
jgi:hypothetical protein